MLTPTTLALAVSLIQVPAAAELSALPPEAAPQDTIVVALEAAEGSALSGSAQLGTNTEGGAEVTIEVQGAEATAELAAFLVAGTCDAPGEVLAPLGTVAADGEGAGTATSPLPLPLDELLASPATVQVHATGASPGQALLCGTASAAAPGG